MDLQSAKAVVRRYYDSLKQATPDSIEGIIAAATVEPYRWRGMHPFHELTGAAAVAETFWKPFLAAFRHVQRREDVFMAGLNEIDGYQSTWVCSMGHLMGLFDGPWLGIRPHRRMAFLRYAEFHRVEGDKIVETAFFFDILHVMQQVGLNPLPPQTGAHMVQPGPMTHDGLLTGPQDPEEGRATLALINKMIGDLGQRGAFPSPQEELRRCWHEDMIWWGPAGIGATYTIDRYIDQHVMPFRNGLKDRIFNGHLCRFAESRFGGFFGWPNLTLTPTGGYLGVTTSGGQADMRVVDIYRREGDKLAENWIFIDILHFLAMQGLDVLARMKEVSGDPG
ncbi:MAG: hypothetical protein ABW026_01175 [Microvirga sp.]